MSPELGEVRQGKLAAADPAHLRQACVYAAANADKLTMQVVLNYLTLLLKGCPLTLRDISNTQHSSHALLLQQLRTQGVLLQTKFLQLLGCLTFAIALHEVMNVTTGGLNIDEGLLVCEQTHGVLVFAHHIEWHSTNGDRKVKPDEYCLQTNLRRSGL